jgi:hypothetical protein
VSKQSERELAARCMFCAPAGFCRLPNECSSALEPSPPSETDTGTDQGQGAAPSARDVVERIAQFFDTFADHTTVLHIYDRPGGPPGNARVPLSGSVIAGLIRARADTFAANAAVPPSDRLRTESPVQNGFWIVLRDDDLRSRRHKTMDGAANEAIRLAHKEPGHSFYTLGCEERIRVDRDQSPSAPPSDQGAALRAGVDLADIEARADAAPPGPWTLGNYAHDKTDQLFVEWPGREAAVFLDGDGVNLNTFYPKEVDRAAMDFIAHARTDIPALIAEVRRLQLLAEDRKSFAAGLERGADELRTALKSASHLADSERARGDRLEAAMYEADALRKAGLLSDAWRTIQAALAASPPQQESPSADKS